MAEGFQHAYAQLTRFAGDHPEIEIGDSVISIPESVRRGFYALFNKAREAFVEEEFPLMLAGALTLKDKYNRAVQTAAGWLSLEDPPTVSPLRRFLRDPDDCLKRELFDPLFDLLKRKESIDGFKKRASAEIEEIFPSLFRGGYEKWAVLSLLNLVGVEKAFRVHARTLNPGERTKPAALAPVEQVPVPEESMSFYFDQPRNSIFAVPDFIVYSSRLRRFIGIRSDFRECSYNALNASVNRTWYPVDADLLKLLGRGLTLIYVAEQPESIALVADVAQFCAPDLILLCADSMKLNQTDALEIMKRADKSLRPPRGAYIITNDHWFKPPEEARHDGQDQPGKEDQNIRILTVGYDEAKLMPVVEALFDSRGPVATT